MHRAFPPALLVAAAAISCDAGEATDASCRCASGLTCTANGACVGAARSSLGPSCSSCSWAYGVCLEIARAETLADLQREQCGLIVCLVWHHLRTTACEKSYTTCTRGCEPR